MVASQPMQSFPCLGALDAAVQLIARNDSDTDASRRRSALGWDFAREASIATVIVRMTCQVPLDARAVMVVAQRLLRTPTPAAAGGSVRSRWRGQRGCRGLTLALETT